MAKIVFTSHLNGIAPMGEQSYPGATVADVLDAAFTDYPKLKHYILDDQDRLRRHVVIFVDDRQLAHGDSLAVPVGTDSEVYILQALSGG